MAFDAPLFALAKFVQRKWLEAHGENKFIAMFGDLGGNVENIIIIMMKSGCMD